MSPYRNKKKIPFLLVVVLLIVGALCWLSISWIRNFRGATAPLYGDVISLNASSKQSLIKKVTALQTELDAKEAFLVALSTLEKENESLKAEFGRIQEGETGLLARVIVPPNRSIYDTVVIDVGVDDGVFVGQNVYAFGSVALGTISEVLPQSSTVLLFSASNRQTAGTTTGSDIVVTLIGRGGGEYEVRMPRDVVFQEGGVISEQSLGVYPLATIQKIVTDPRDPFQRLLAKIPINLQTMKWVIVR